jgi:hypothetical protein
MFRKNGYRFLSLLAVALFFSLPMTSCSADDQPQSTIHTTRSEELTPKKDSVKKKSKKEPKYKIQSFRTNDPLNI